MSAIHPASLMSAVDQALSIKYNNLVYELRDSGHDIITLSLGEAFFDLPLPRFDDLSGVGLHHYSHSRGLPQLRQRLAKYYQDEFQVPVDPEQ